jgi:hypothetical protein
MIEGGFSSMPYYNNYNNKDSEKSEIQTKGMRVTNGQCACPMALEWGYQRDMLKLIFSPELPVNEQTENRRYDYQHSWMTCVSRAKCVDLIEQVKDKIIPALEKKEAAFVSVPVAEVNQIGIGVLPDEKWGAVAYIKLIRNIDPGTRTTKEVIAYIFRKGEVVVNYNSETGEFGDRLITDNEFALFVRDMESFVAGTSNAWNHANRTVDRTYKDMIAGDIRAIGAKVGAEVSTPYAAQRAGAKYGQTSLFDNSSMNAPVDQITSLDDLNIGAE